MNKLFENYKERINVSESIYRQSHNGEKLSNSRKLCIAQCLKNVDNFLSESFNASSGTQRSDFGAYKKFCLNLTTCALPNLILPELVIVSPMTSISGSVAYIKYVSSVKKGGQAAGTVLNTPFALGNVDESYTSDRVSEQQTAVEKDGAVVINLDWFPVIEGSVRLKVNGAEVSDFTLDPETGLVTINSGAVAGDTVKALYVYDNIVVPQNNIPMIKAEMANIPLYAKARRIAVYYSNLAAFQAKQDYGVNLGDQLAEKAVAQLQYEIDTEGTQLLVDLAQEDADLVWSKTQPIGVSLTEHYIGFTVKLATAAQKIYDRTKRFTPNYMLCASDIIPVLSLIPGFNQAPGGMKNGPYFAGTINGLKVFVTPNIEAGKFVVGVNGDDMMSSAAVYAPYMPIVPTQLMQYNDGGTTQGWSTMYDLKPLNEDLVIAGKITA